MILVLVINGRYIDQKVVALLTKKCRLMQTYTLFTERVKLDGLCQKPPKGSEMKNSWIGNHEW